MERPGESAATEPVDFDQLVADHHGRIYQTILGLIRDPVEAEDLTQETLIRAYRGLSEFRGEASLATWLWRIARNVVVDRYRRTAHQEDLGMLSLVEDGLDDLAEEPSLTPAQATEQHLSGECVRDCVDSLPDPYRQAVELHDMVGLTNPEIADRLGLPLATVKIRVHRGRRRFRTTCEQNCEVYADGRNELACQPKSVSNE